MVRYLLPEMLVEGGVRVIIGAENREDAMKECSMVVTRYGVPGEVNGVLGVIGPRRMPYGRAISSVRYMGSLMSDLVAELYTGPGRQ
jgi:heat-inducible transcriptional repressor